MTAALPSKPRQLRLDMRERIERTLVPMEVAMDRLKLDEDDVLGLIDSGKIRWAWNIARSRARRRDVRVWQNCLAELTAPFPDKLCLRSDSVSLPLVLALAVPPPKPDALAVRVIRGVDLKHRLSCSQFHLSNLLRDGELRSHGTAPQSHTPKIVYDSVLEFLTRRVL